MNCFWSYLTNRSQFVNIEGFKSDIHNVSCGVSRGGPILYSPYTSPLGNCLRCHNILFHFYADDTQLFTSCGCNDDTDVNLTALCIEECLADMKTWICHWISLNLEKIKTELLVFHSRYRWPSEFTLNFDEKGITPADKAMNIGVIFDKTMTMSLQINSICTSAYYHLRNIARIRKFLHLETTEILVHAFISAKLD